MCVRVQKDVQKVPYPVTPTGTGVISASRTTQAWSGRAMRSREPRDSPFPISASGWLNIVLRILSLIYLVLIM